MFVTRMGGAETSCFSIRQSTRVPCSTDFRFTEFSEDGMRRPTPHTQYPLGLQALYGLLRVRRIPCHLPPPSAQSGALVTIHHLIPVTLPS